MLIIRLAPIALLLAAATAPAQDAAPAPPPKPLSMQQVAALKCSAAFALGAASQAKGGGREWPQLMPRGREFLVQSSAAIMDDTGRTRDQVAAELRGHAATLATPAALAEAMPPCLALLAAAGL